MSEKRDERLEELIREPQAVESETEKELQTQTDEHKPEKKNLAKQQRCMVKTSYCPWTYG